MLWLRNIISHAFILIGIMTPTAYAQNYMLTRAIMDAYAQMIAENPRDYEAYFRRANEYYRQNDYTRSLADVNKALDYTPVSDKSTLFQEYMLRAGIYEMGHRHENALDDLNKAIGLDPTAYTALCQRGNVELELGLYREAKQDYTRLQRYNPRSLEALFGLAHVAVCEQNIGLANEYMEQAVALAQNDPNAYIHRARVKKRMNDLSGAATDLLQAFAMDNGSSKALAELTTLANDSYPAVVSALTNAIQQVPDGGMYYYMRATIAASHFHYSAAIDDLNHIIKAGLYSYDGIYASLAECYYALCEFDKALDNIDYAIANYADEGNHNNHYVIRSKIYRAIRDYDSALSSVDMALTKDPQLNAALQEKALVLISMDKPSDASSLLGEASVNAPQEPYPYMRRAWVMNDYLNQSTGASACYERMTDNVNNPTDVKSLFGFGLLFNGKTQDAADWMERCLEAPDNDGLAHYYGACFYSWANQPAKALQCMETALHCGYANKYNWTIDNDARVNVAPLRDEKQFYELMQQYDELFQSK